MKPKVIDVMRRFLPDYLAPKPPLSDERRRAIWAITNCQTPVLGGHTYHCNDCQKWEYASHSCNHRSCSQCGGGDTAKWVDRELNKRVGAPYFMVTFTLPAEFRELFFGPDSKAAYDLFFTATSKSLSTKLAEEKGFKAVVNGFTGILHTWNQRLNFHPHIHYIVPGAGIDADGNVVTVKYDNYLVNIHHLKGAFRENIRKGLEQLGWQVDPIVWTRKWGIDIKEFGDGENVIKYLGAYVCKTAIGNSRILSINEIDKTVTFTWKDRSNKKKIKVRTETIPGVEFVNRYLRHVLPRGLRSIRYYGYCHPTAKKKRERIAFHTGLPLGSGDKTDSPNAPDDPGQLPPGTPICSCCGKGMQRIGSFPPQQRPKKKKPINPALLTIPHPPPS